MKSPITATVLIDEVIRTLKSEIVPNVSADKKYEILMCINALEISHRSLTNTNENNKNSIKSNVTNVINRIRSGEYDNLEDDESKLLMLILAEDNDKELRISVPEKKYQLLKN